MRLGGDIYSLKQYLIKIYAVRSYIYEAVTQKYCYIRKNVMLISSKVLSENLCLKFATQRKNKQKRNLNVLICSGLYINYYFY